jgi:hypothetical protein
MPDYIVMSSKTIGLFHLANPTMRIVITLREPVARMYSYFSMQLRFGWSPINHMGKNPCMQVTRTPHPHSHPHPTAWAGPVHARPSTAHSDPQA